jgi:hypothetical protein
MQLIPFLSVDGLPFTVSREDVERQWGRPVEEGFNLVGLTELDYGDVVFRFQSSGRLEEITTQADVVKVDGRSVSFGALTNFVHQHDEGTFRRAGFIVSPRFGLAFDPASDRWVTALAAHCLDEWRKL